MWDLFEEMLEFLLSLFGGCLHTNITWPQQGTKCDYVVCLTCVRLIPYDVNEMRPLTAAEIKQKRVYDQPIRRVDSVRERSTLGTVLQFPPAHADLYSSSLRAERKWTGIEKHFDPRFQARSSQ